MASPGIEPADRRRCQAERRLYHPFALGGPVKRVERCDNKPTVILVEESSNTDGLVGEMSLCGPCLVIFEKTSHPPVRYEWLVESACVECVTQ